MSDISYLDKLNPQQLQAVMHLDTPLVVVSGPGSGKSRVITNKFVFLVKEEKLDPQEILAITFTNKAANVMKERICDYLDLDPKSLPWVTTFHSMGAKMLRQDIDRLGRDTNYSIYDQNESEKTVKEILKEMKLNEYYDVDDVKRAISDVKNRLDMKILDTYWINIIPHIHSIYKKYKERLEESNALDFDDLLLYTFKLLKSDREILYKWYNTWKYFLVDEYQDTNIAQHAILRLLVGKRNCLTVVGDPLQCLYTWRSAHPENILKFEESYPTAQTVKLETNYRSTPTIIDAANAVTKHVQGDWKVKLLNIKATKDKPDHEEMYCYEFSTRYQEAEFIAQKIQSLKHADGYNYGEIAVLMRMSFLSRFLEEQFIRYNIPYQVVGGFKFMDRAEVRDMLSYLKFAYKSVDEIAFRRCINTPPRGIGEKTFYEIQSKYKTDWYQALKDVKFPKKKMEAIEEFFILIDEIKDKIENDPAGCMRYVFENSGYKEYLAKRHDNADDREENVEELIGMIRFHQNNGSNFSAILEYFALMQEQDNLNEKSDKVKIMTIHASKGLEFKNIFLMGAEDGILPSKRAHGNPMQMEEERRLFYVAITRAIERVIISYCVEPKYVTNGGKTEMYDTYPSPYLRDIKDYFKFFKKY